MLSSYPYVCAIASVTLSTVPQTFTTLPTLLRYTSRAMYNPTDGEAVAAVGELTSLRALDSMKRTMMADCSGRVILSKRPLVTDDVLEAASKMPAGTFGHSYAHYMNSNKFTPSGRLPVTHIPDPTLAYVMTRYRQLHDFFHAITCCQRTVEEEVALKILEWRHTGLPLGILAIPGGAPHLDSTQMRRLRKFYWEWAEVNGPQNTHSGRVVPMYLCHPWESFLELSFDEVVERTGIIPLDRYKAQNGSTRASLLAEAAASAPHKA